MRLCKVTGTYIISIKGDINCIIGVNNILATSRMNIDIILLIFYYIILFYFCPTYISVILPSLRSTVIFRVDNSRCYPLVQ